MRKFFNTLFAVVAMVTANAQDVKNQFVKWASVPVEVTNGTVSAEKAGEWLKAAMTGKDIPGATVRTTAATYKAVWGDAAYDYISKQTNFFLVPADGTEKNFALDANGNPVPAGFLKQGTTCVAVNLSGKKVKVAKIGTNGCINAIIPGSTTSDDTDPDTQPNPIVINDPVKTPGNTFNIGTSGGNNCCGEFINGFNAGFDKRSIAMYQDFAVFKEVAELKVQTAQPQVMQTGGWVLSGGPMVQASLPAQQVVVQQQKIPFGQTWGGQALATAAGVFVGNELSERVNLFGNRYYAQGYNYNYYPRYQQFGPGFQWNGGGGYTDYSGGPIHPATGGRIASSSELIPGAGTGGSNYGAGFQWR